MSEKNTRRYLQWYEKDGDNALGNEDLKEITLQELQLLFNVPPENPMYDSWEVKENHLKKLSSCVNHAINLEQHDYFVETSAIK